MYKSRQAASRHQFKKAEKKHIQTITTKSGKMINRSDLGGAGILNDKVIVTQGVLLRRDFSAALPSVDFAR